MSRLTSLHITIIGSVVAVILGIVLYFAAIKPKKEQIDIVNAAIVQTQQVGGTQEMVTQQTGAARAAAIETAQINDTWRIYEARFMPELRLGGSNAPGAPVPTVNPLLGIYEYSAYRDARGWHGLRDLPTLWGTWLKSWYDVQPAYGIKIYRTAGQDFPIDSFSTDPNDITKLNFISFPAPAKPWPVTIEARSFNDAMRHLQQFNRMRNHGVPIVNGVALSGQSPRLLVSYDLSMTIIPHTPPAPADPSISSTAGPAAAPPGFGPPPGIGGPRGAGPRAGRGGAPTD